MPRVASARRYAQAVFQIARENDELDTWLDDLALLARSLEDEGLARFLNAPQVPVPRKTEVIRSAVGDSVGPLAANLMALLAARNIVSLLPSVADQYQALLDAHQGIERAEVTSAVSLTDEEQHRIEGLLEDIAGKQIKLTSRVEPSVLGGLVARVGDRVIDGSIKTRLQAMRRELVERVS